MKRQHNIVLIDGALAAHKNISLTSTFEAALQKREVEHKAKWRISTIVMAGHYLMSRALVNTQQSSIAGLRGLKLVIPTIYLVPIARLHVLLLVVLHPVVAGVRRCRGRCHGRSEIVR